MVTDMALSEEDLREVKAQASALGELAKAEPELEPRLRELVEREFSGRDIDSQTISRLYERFAEYLGDWDSSQLLVGAISYPDEERQDILAALGAVQEGERQRLLDVVRSIRALYGPELTQAARIWGQDPDDWMAIATDIEYALALETWLVGFTLTKYDGKDIRIQGPALSMANLIAFMLNTLNKIPEGETPFPPDAIDDLRDEFETFVDRFSPIAAS